MAKDKEKDNETKENPKRKRHGIQPAKGSDRWSQEKLEIYQRLLRVLPLFAFGCPVRSMARTIMNFSCDLKVLSWPRLVCGVIA